MVGLVSAVGFQLLETGQRPLLQKTLKDSVISPESLERVSEHQGIQAFPHVSPVLSEVKTAVLESEIKLLMGPHINWETGAKSLSNINIKLDSAKFPFTRRIFG